MPSWYKHTFYIDRLILLKEATYFLDKFGSEKRPPSNAVKVSSVSDNTSTHNYLFTIVHKFHLLSPVRAVQYLCLWDISVFREVTPCTLVERYHSLEGTCWHHFHDAGMNLQTAGTTEIFTLMYQNTGCYQASWHNDNTSDLLLGAARFDSRLPDSGFRSFPQ